MKTLIHSILCAVFLTCICPSNLSAQSDDGGKKYYSNPKMGIIPDIPKAYQDATVVNKNDDQYVELVGEETEISPVDTARGNFDKESYYDYEYSARIYRFHRGMYFGYFDPWYTDLYWYTGNPFYYGTSIYLCWDPFWSPYWSPYWDYYYGWGWGYYYPYYYPYYGGWGGYAWAPGHEPGHGYLGGIRSSSVTPRAGNGRGTKGSFGALHRFQTPTSAEGRNNARGTTASQGRLSKPESVTRNRTTQTVTRNSNTRGNSGAGGYHSTVGTNSRGTTFNSNRNTSFDNSRNNSRTFDNSRNDSRTPNSSRTNTRTYDNNRNTSRTSTFSSPSRSNSGFGGSSMRGGSPMGGRSGSFGGGAPRRR